MLKTLAVVAALSLAFPVAVLCQAPAAKAPGEERKEIVLSPKTMEAYTGRYQLGPARIAELTVEDGKLYGQIAGQQKMRLFPEGRRDFFLKTIDAQVSFQVDKTGKATGLVLHQNGRDTLAPRLDAPVAR